MDSSFRTRPSIGIPLGYLDKEIIVGTKKHSEGTKERLSGKRLGIVYGRKGMEQVCILNDIIGGGLWSLVGISQIIGFRHRFRRVVHADQRDVHCKWGGYLAPPCTSQHCLLQLMATGQLVLQRRLRSVLEGEFSVSHHVWLRPSHVD